MRSGCVPREMLYDNMKTVVLQRDAYQTSQFPDNLTIDARLEGKVELFQRFDPRQTSLLQPELHTALMSAVPFLL